MRENDIEGQQYHSLIPLMSLNLFDSVSSENFSTCATTMAPAHSFKICWHCVQSTRSILYLDCFPCNPVFTEACWQVLGGMELTGPSLNPAVTLSWAIHHRQHRLVEHLVVFWLAPILGGVPLPLSLALTHLEKHIQDYCFQLVKTNHTRLCQALII